MKLREFKDLEAVNYGYKNWYDYISFCKSQGFDENEIGYDNIAIRFAKYHVEQALQSASEKAKAKFISFQIYSIDKESILNSYDLNNII